MVVIRLSRGGAKNRPFYHVVVTNSRNARDSGNFIERLGYFNPEARGEEVRLHLNQERIAHWTAQGAQTSKRVNKLMKLFTEAAANPSHAEKSKKTKKTVAKETDQAAE